MARDSHNLKGIFQEAAEIAAVLPVSMQSVGFSRAVDILLGSAGTTTSSATTKSAASVRKPVGVEKKEKVTRQGRPGPKAALKQIEADGFFRSSKTITEMQDHLRKKRGHDYSQNELAISAVRLVRDQILDRETNESGQYVYVSKAALQRHAGAQAS